MEPTQILKAMEESKAKVDDLEKQLAAEKNKGSALLAEFQMALEGLQKTFGVATPAKTGKRGRPPKNPDVSVTGAGAEKPRVCGICGESGHNARTCPKKTTS